jgi:hypothetical protein
MASTQSISCSSRDHDCKYTERLERLERSYRDSYPLHSCLSIMLPGTPHSVYTFESTICQGTTFLSYPCLSLSINAVLTQRDKPGEFEENYGYTMPLHFTFMSIALASEEYRHKHGITRRQAQEYALLLQHVTGIPSDPRTLTLPYPWDTLTTKRREIASIVHGLGPVTIAARQAVRRWKGTSAQQE